MEQNAWKALVETKYVSFVCSEKETSKLLSAQKGK
jgi:hypothetical protein